MTAHAAYSPFLVSGLMQQCDIHTVLCRAFKGAKFDWTHRPSTFTPCSNASSICLSQLLICCSSKSLCCHSAAAATRPSCSTTCHSCSQQRSCTLGVDSYWSYPCCWWRQVAVVGTLHNCRYVFSPSFIGTCRTRLALVPQSSRCAASACGEFKQHLAWVLLWHHRVQAVHTILVNLHRHLPSLQHLELVLGIDNHMQMHLSCTTCMHCKCMMTDLLFMMQVLHSQGNSQDQQLL